MVGIFGHQDMGEQGRGGAALGDWPVRGGHLMNGAADPAAVAGATDADHPQPGRHMVEHLADRLADCMQGATAAGADPVLQIEAAVHTLEMVRQARTVLLQSRRGGCSRRQCCLGARDIGLEVIEAEPQLIVIERFGPASKLVALQLSDDEAEPLYLGLRLREPGPLGCEHSDHLLQHVHIVRHGSKIDVHGSGGYTGLRLTSSIDTVLSQSAAASSHHRRTPLLLRSSPVDAIDQHRQQRRGQ